MAKERANRKQPLTDAVLAALPCTDTPYEVADGYPGHTGTGLLVRVQPSGIRSLYATYKVAGQGNGTDRHGRPRAGKARRVFLGRWPDEIDVEDARARAQKMVKAARKGTDPAPRSDANGGTELTIDDLVPKFLEHGTGNAKGFKPRLRDVVQPRWGKLTPARFPVQEYRDVLWALVESEQNAAARTLRDATRAFFTWANERHHLGLAANPGALPKGSKLAAALKVERERFRLYTDKEIKAVWKATENWRFPDGLITRLAMLVPTRSSYLRQLRWSDVHKETFNLPPPTGRKRVPPRLPITPGIRAILDAAAEHRLKDCDHVFWVEGREGPKAANDPKASKLRELSKTKQTIKALQHTGETRMAELRIAQHIIDYIKGHGLEGARRRYQQHKPIDEAREALESYEKHLKEVINGAQNNT